MYLWDTNILRHHGENHPVLAAHLDRVSESEIGLPSIVVAEVLRRRCEYVLKAEPDQIARANELLLDTLRIVQAIRIIVLDHAAIVVMKQLLVKHKSHKRHADLMIAAMAVAGKHTVVTRNRKDFADLLPPAQLQNWIDDPPRG
jgi:predicted nucleic acid-binding protein